MNIIGGQSIQADRLLRAFKDDSEIELRLSSIDARFPLLLRSIPYVRTAVNATIYYAELLKGVLQSDLIHAFASSFWGYTLWVIPAIWLSRLGGSKIVVNYRDGRAEQHLRTWSSAVSTMKRVDAIVVPSEYLVSVFARFGLKACIIPNAIELTMFRHRERATVRPIFLTNRGLEPLYNVTCTLRAFRIIQDRYPEARFVVANDGPLRTELEALAAGLHLNAAFVGAVPQSRMVELYDSADIYVMSPLIDNMPGTVLECFASGLPVVTTASGGVPYVAENGRNALTIPPQGSAEELAGACFRLLEEPGLALRLTREGYGDCVERYSVALVRDQWHSLYLQLYDRDTGNNRS
jgi:glycosyltransferase involved in cell wall biosynthesis